MVLFAFSLQDQVEKYGAYVSIACFFGLAVLSLLYFAQAREVKRLREWAGRAPERAAEIEARAIAQAEEARRAQEAPAPQPQPVAAPVNGAVKLKPAEVAALAFARAAGVHAPHAPRPHAAPAVAEAPVTEVAGEPPATEVAAVSASAATADAAAAQDLAPVTNGRGAGDVPAPATPAARRAEAPPPPAASPPPP